MSKKTKDVASAPEAQEVPEGERLLLEVLDRGDATLGDFMNVCAEVTTRSYAEARGFKHAAITKSAKHMLKRWRQFMQSWNRTLMLARDFAAKEGLGQESVEYYDAEGPDDPCS